MGKMIRVADMIGGIELNREVRLPAAPDMQLYLVADTALGIETHCLMPLTRRCTMASDTLMTDITQSVALLVDPSLCGRADIFDHDPVIYVTSGLRRFARQLSRYGSGILARDMVLPVTFDLSAFRQVAGDGWTANMIAESCRRLQAEVVTRLEDETKLTDVWDVLEREFQPPTMNVARRFSLLSEYQVRRTADGGAEITMLLHRGLWNAAVSGTGLVPIDNAYFNLADGLERAVYQVAMKLRNGGKRAATTISWVRNLIGGDSRGLSGQIRRLATRGAILDCQVEIVPKPGCRAADAIVFSAKE